MAFGHMEAQLERPEPVGETPATSRCAEGPP